VRSQVAKAGAIRQTVCDKLFSGPRNQDLATVRRRHETGASVERSTYVVTGSQVSLACVDRDAHANVDIYRPVRALQRTLGIERTSDRVTRLSENGQHAVALASRLDDLPLIPFDLLQDDSVMTLERSLR
jgi:hypothetical protein